MQLIKVEDFNKLHTNQRLFLSELNKKGVNLEILDLEMELIRISKGGQVDYLIDRYTSLIPHNMIEITANKHLTKKLLRKANISTPYGKLFDYQHLPQAYQFANKISFPVVVKPNFGSHGEHIYLVESYDELKQAVKQMSKHNGQKSLFLIEEYFEGKEHRIFIDKKGNYAVLAREPANIIGDGKSTIAQLVKKTSFQRTNPRKTALGPIVINHQSRFFLAKNNKTMATIPQKNERVCLHFVSNVAQGGFCTDLTDETNQSLIKIALKALLCFPGLSYAGVDILCKEHDSEQNADSYRVLEINANPGFAMHMFPGKGKPRNVARIVANLLFPE